MHPTMLVQLQLVIIDGLGLKASSITTVELIGRRRRRREAGPVVDVELVQGWLEHRSCRQADRESNSDLVKFK